MGEQAVAQRFFGYAGGPQQAAAPEKTENADQQPQAEDDQGLVEQAVWVGGQQGQVIHDPLDHPGNEELEQVHHDQAEETDDNRPAVCHQIGLDQLEGLHHTSV